MALTTARTGLTPQQWDDKFFMEYVRDNRFKRYMGTDENSIIHQALVHLAIGSQRFLKWKMGILQAQ